MLKKEDLELGIPYIRDELRKILSGEYFMNLTGFTSELQRHNCKLPRHSYCTNTKSLAQIRAHKAFFT